MARSRAVFAWRVETSRDARDTRQGAKDAPRSDDPGTTVTITCRPVSSQAIALGSDQVSDREPTTIGTAHSLTLTPRRDSAPLALLETRRRTTYEMIALSRPRGMMSFVFRCIVYPCSRCGKPRF